MQLQVIHDGLKQIEVLNSLPSGVTIADAGGFFLYANKSAAKILGYTEQELTGKHWSFLYYPADAEVLTAQMGELLSKGSWNGSVKMLTAKGDNKNMQLSLTVLPSGLVSCVFHSIDDIITQQLKLDDLKQAVASAMDGIALLDADGNYYYLNEKHITHFGYAKEEELLGRSWRIFYSEDEIKRIEEDLFPKMAKEGRWQGETTGIDINGKPIYQEITLTPLAHGGLICIMRNITEKKLRDNEIKKLALVASNTNNVVVITNTRQEIEWMNEKAESIFEEPLKAVAYTSFFDLLAKRNLSEDAAAALKQNIEKGEADKLDIQLQQNDEKKIWLSVSANQVLESSRIVNYVYLLMDVTESKEVQEKLFDALAKEKNLNDLKSHFVNLTSHEFRTPLTSIQSSIDIIKLLSERDGMLSKDKLTRHVHQMEEEVDRMKELMDNVLVLGKINSGRLDYKPKANSVSVMIEEALNSNRVKQFGKPILPKYTGQHRQIQCDSRLVGHVLHNLIINALKYSQNSPKSPSIDVLYGKDEMLFEITDFGIGIPADDQAYIFESFFRATNTQDISGTGLGLPIVKQFVELHKGKISFESELGVKTVFSLTLPN